MRPVAQEGAQRTAASVGQDEVRLGTLHAINRYLGNALLLHDAVNLLQHWQGIFRWLID